MELQGRQSEMAIDVGSDEEEEWEERRQFVYPWGTGDQGQG